MKAATMGERVLSKTSSKLALKAIISVFTGLSRKTNCAILIQLSLTTITKVNGKDIIIKNDEETFERLLVI